MKKIYESTKGKIFFNNGYFNLINNNFIDNFDNVYTTEKINRDYKENYFEQNQEKIQAIYNRVLIPVFGEQLLENILLFTCRALAGMTNDKTFSVIMGERDSGKSKFKNLCETAFGSYVGIVNMNSLLFDNSGGDESKTLSWLVDNYDKRLLFGSEIKTNGTKIDGNLIKSICSGSDKIKMRKNFNDEKDFYIQCTLSLLANDLPAFDPIDTVEKMIPFNCPHKFVNEILESDKTSNPHFIMADPTIDEFVMDETIGEAFIYIILKSFKNYKVIFTESQTAFIENFRTEDEFREFKKSYEITKNPKDKIKTEDLRQFIKYKNLNISLAKISTYLINRGCIHQKAVKIDGKTYNGYRGLRKIFEESNNDEVNPLDI